MLLIIYIPSPASASPIDALSDAVAEGITKSLSIMGDSLINYSISNDSNISSAPVSKRGKIGDAMFRVLTFETDFIHNPWANSVHDFTSMVYVVLFIIYLALSVAYYTLRETSPEFYNEITWLMDINSGVGGRPYSDFISDVFKSIIFLIGGYYAVYIIVIFANILTRMITTSVLDSIATTNSDGIVYLFMAIAIFLLTVFVMWRGIVLTIFWAYLLLFLGAYLFRSLRPAVTSMFRYFFIMVFMMFILILIAVAGIWFIETIPPMSVLKNIAYVALILMLFFAALYMTLGTLWGSASRAASVIVLRKI